MFSLRTASSRLTASLAQSTVRLAAKPSPACIISPVHQVCAYSSLHRSVPKKPAVDCPTSHPGVVDAKTRSQPWHESTLNLAQSLVSEVLAMKEERFLTSHELEPAQEAVSRMVNEAIGCVMVLKGDQAHYENWLSMGQTRINTHPMSSVAGVLTERDFLKKVLFVEKSAVHLKVKDVMSTSVLTVKPSDSLLHLLDQMAHNRVRHFPVVNSNGEAVGVISVMDVVTYLSSQGHAVRSKEPDVPDDGFVSGFFTGAFFTLLLRTH
eukprot:TRINITY_DN2794_c0_g1::TRINITY_DN2794_c0_g1_i1::g.27316::m.27316 TRINITY_DN2794_c0_g1::TRINITY_DN2794_c0_g1_i1::g.27316  ORF type:complete len:265 (-),score=62.23,sp/Q9LEV3/CBSX3_ARATH/27.12/2e-12,CBS/PF00571.23/9.3e+03,CBS/PF00571.23/0.93,CBS/PF00571.23/3.9e-15,FA_FANCE/PF11510.3/0.3,FA_FANCE/PF11510.3/14 TRINITY_DN2794_c0_g1_i1:9-803(-)